MIRNLFLAAGICLSLEASGQASSYNERVQQYITRYKEFAETEQQRSGIPAAITLGQGILETEAGKSELATIANNHFGIKCKKEWSGETFTHTDDAPDECFRKYPSALHSYQDHSDYLKSSKRYNSCFACNPTDYASWAKELRRCGYATNPRYAYQLIKIIEDFHLQDYTYAAMGRKEPILIASAGMPAAAVVMAEKSTPSDSIPGHDTPSASPVAAINSPVYGKAISRNGIKGFYAHKGDVLLEYAIQYKVRYAKLLEINHLPDAPLADDMFIALEKGGKVIQILSRDASETSSVNLAAPVAASVQQVEKPAAAMSIAPASNSEATSTTALSASQSGQQTETPAPIITEPIAITRTASASIENPVAAIEAPALVVEKKATEAPYNIASEVAIEEAKPVAREEEPKDEFSRMKARFDKVVFAPTTAKVPVPQPVATKESLPTPVPTPAAATTTGKEFHVVLKGETAFGIAKRYNISMRDLMTLNNLDFEAIKVGQKLRVK